MPTSLKIHSKYRYLQKNGFRITTTEDHMSHWEERHQWNTMPCRRHVINRSTLKKIDLLITTIFKFENSPGCQSENREGYTLSRHWATNESIFSRLLSNKFMLAKVIPIRNYLNMYLIGRIPSF